jgi:hypothetical protein
MLQSILNVPQKLAQMVGRRESVDDILSDLQSKIARFHAVAAAHSSEIEHQSEVITEAEKALAHAASEKARALILADRFADFVSV